MRQALPRRGLPEVDLGPAPLLLGAADRAEGDLPPDPVPRRRRGQRLRGRRRQPRLRQHALRPAHRLLPGPAVGRPRGLGAHPGAALRRGAADARRRRSRAGRPGRPAAARARRAPRRRRHLPQDPRRGLPGEPREDRPRPLLRRRGPGPHRLPAVRPLHGRLPARRQEHAGQELPLAGGAARRQDRGGTDGDRGAPARRRRRLRRLRDHQRALRPPPRPRQAHDHAPAASSSPPARSAPTS